MRQAAALASKFMLQYFADVVEVCLANVSHALYRLVIRLNAPVPTALIDCAHTATAASSLTNSNFYIYFFQVASFI